MPCILHVMPFTSFILSYKLMVQQKRYKQVTAKTLEWNLWPKLNKTLNISDYRGSNMGFFDTWKWPHNFFSSEKVQIVLLFLQNWGHKSTVNQIRTYRISPPITFSLSCSRMILWRAKSSGQVWMWAVPSAGNVLLLNHTAHRQNFDTHVVNSDVTAWLFLVLTRYYTV